MPLPLRSIRNAVVGAVARAGICAALLLGGCSPTYNWREVRFEDAGLVALLPCKPDRAQKPVPISAAVEAPLDMMGCEAGGATYTLSHVHLGESTDAAAALARWQAANDARLGAKPTRSGVFAPQGAPVLPGSVKLEIEAKGTDGQPLSVQMASFMREAAGARKGVDLFQAAIYGGKKGGMSEAQAADSFFSGLLLR